MTRERPCPRAPSSAAASISKHQQSEEDLARERPAQRHRVAAQVLDEGGARALGDVPEIAGRSRGDRGEIVGRFVGDRGEIRGRLVGDSWEIRVVFGEILGGVDILLVRGQQHHERLLLLARDLLHEEGRVRPAISVNWWQSVAIRGD